MHLLDDPWVQGQRSPREPLVLSGHPWVSLRLSSSRVTCALQHRLQALLPLDLSVCPSLHTPRVSVPLALLILTLIPRTWHPGPQARPQGQPGPDQQSRVLLALDQLLPALDQQSPGMGCQGKAWLQDQYLLDRPLLFMVLQLGRSMQPLPHRRDRTQLQ